MTLIREIGMVGNSTEARNALGSGGVKIDEKTITDPKMMIQVNKEETHPSGEEEVWVYS